MDIFNQLESEVRSYCRTFPAVFERAEGCYMYDRHGTSYLDFFSGAGALNYGHNPPAFKKKLLEYIEANGITHSLDMATVAKENFLKKFQSHILAPRGMDYKVQFPGPTGTNAVEGSLKLARKITGREKVMFFTQGFHGMTLGALSVSGNMFKRAGAGLPLTNTVCMPYDNYFGSDVDTIEYIDRLIECTGSGVDLPAAVIVETVQAEGGVNVASSKWLRRLQSLCRKHKIILIVDDIQAGCGRTGTFFSFEGIGIDPDIICLSKSLSGYGLPLSLCLIRPELDIWEPGEHNGTFRGHNPAFVTATEALNYWKTPLFTQEIIKKGHRVKEFLNQIKNDFAEDISEIRGRGLIYGIAFSKEDVASKVSAVCFENNLLVETSGADCDVLKLLPPLTIDFANLEKGLNRLRESIELVTDEATIACR